MRLLLVIALCAAAPLPALAQTPEFPSIEISPTSPPASSGAVGKPSVITRPEWDERPDAAQMRRIYPKRALRAKVTGRGGVHCSVSIEGALQDCVIAFETPEGYGFGDAALAASKFFKMRPKTRDGVPVAGGHVTIPINFMLDR